MRTIFIVLDGVADLPCINNKTPLEAAKTPNLDHLAKNSKLGYVYPIKENFAPESDAAVMSILGYDPKKYFTGRGPLEALGSGFKIKKGYLALRVNFATIKNNKLIDRRAGRNLSTKEGSLLSSTINKKLKLSHPFILIHSTEHRGSLIFKGKFSSNVSNVDPAYEKQGNFSKALSSKNLQLKRCYPLDNKKETIEASSIINEFMQKSIPILKNHYINKKRIKKHLLPANIILPRDAGTSLPNLPKKKDWIALVNMPLETAIAKLAGMKVFTFEHAKTNLLPYKNHYANLTITIKNSLKHINSSHNTYIHFKETDIPGHDGLPLEKKRMIELLDKKFFKHLKKIKNTIIIITADHSTPCKLKSHSSDPVPLLVYGLGKNSSTRFTEKESKKGSLGKLYGKDILKLINH